MSLPGTGAVPDGYSGLVTRHKAADLRHEYIHPNLHAKRNLCHKSFSTISKVTIATVAVIPILFIMMMMIVIITTLAIIKVVSMMMMMMMMMSFLGLAEVKLQMA